MFKMYVLISCVWEKLSSSQIFAYYAVHFSCGLLIKTIPISATHEPTNEIVPNIKASNER